MFMQNFGGTTKSIMVFLKKGLFKGEGRVVEERDDAYIVHRYSVHKINPFHSLFAGYPQMRQTDNNNFIQLIIMG